MHPIITFLSYSCLFQYSFEIIWSKMCSDCEFMIVMKKSKYKFTFTVNCNFWLWKTVKSILNLNYVIYYIRGPWQLEPMIRYGYFFPMLYWFPKLTFYTIWVVYLARLNFSDLECEFSCLRAMPIPDNRPHKGN